MNLTPELGVVPAISRTLKTLADGTVRLSIDVDPNYRNSALYLLGQPGLTLVVARLLLEPSAATTTTSTLPPAPEAQR